MNNNQVHKKSVSKDNLQNKTNLRPLIFTFLGFFIVFFFAITVILPIISPKVDIPALNDENSTDTVNSNDFKGRIDPRLNSIEQEENAAPAPKLKMEIPPKNQQTEENQQEIDQQNPDSYYSNEEPQEPQNYVPGEDMNSDYNTPSDGSVKTNIKVTQPQKTINKTVKPNTTANIPPRPQPRQLPSSEPLKPITMVKVVMGSYSTPMQARLVSDTLIEMDLNVNPFIKEKNGKYLLQVGSFSDPSKAEGLIQELRNKGFDAKLMYE